MDRRLSSGHLTKEISEEERDEITREFKGIKQLYDRGESYIRAYPGGWLLPSSFHRYSTNISNFKFRPDDILVLTYPKSGTNWTAEIVWNMLYNKDLQHPMQDAGTMAKCSALEIDMLIDLNKMFETKSPLSELFYQVCPGKEFRDGVFLQMAETRQSPRILITHLPISFFNGNLLDSCKVIYVARNPKDVLISFLHFQRLLRSFSYEGSLDQYLNFLIEDKLIYSPFWSHLKEAWAVKDHPNLLYIFYEKLKNETKETYAMINLFIGADLQSSDIDKIIEFTNFASMKKRVANGMLANAPGKENPMWNIEIQKKEGGYMRKGQTGSWKGILNPSQEAKMDLWIRKNTLGTGLNFT